MFTNNLCQYFFNFFIAETRFQKTKNVNGQCILASTELGYKKLIANGLKNNLLLFTGYPVVGSQGKMQTSGSCLHSPPSDPLTSCAWDPRTKGLFFYESTAIFSPPNFKNFIHDVKKLRDLNPNNFCGVDSYNGLLIRFIKGSNAYLGQTEDSVVVDFNYYRADEALLPRLGQEVWEEVEQMAFFKYKARPHWGKNRKLAFLGVKEKYTKMSRFLEVKEMLDPKGMFSSSWSDEIVSGGGGSRGDGCAMDGECVCSEDGHCRPSEGYLCGPGLVYEDARVCRFSSSS